jgi:hypothetical protein
MIEFIIKAGLFFILLPIALLGFVVAFAWFYTILAGVGVIIKKICRIE